PRPARGSGGSRRLVLRPHRVARRVPRPPQPAQRARDIGLALDQDLDPAALREAPVRADTVLAQRTWLVARAQTDPEIVVLVAQRKAGEQARTDEVAPAPEHRGDAHTIPGAQRGVQRARRSDPAAIERATDLAAAPHTA